MLRRIPQYRDGFQIDYLWILLEGKIVVEPAADRIHADIWGDEVWNIRERGYYCEECEQVSCHSFEGVKPWLEAKLAKAFPKAMYLQDCSVQFVEV